MAQFAQLIPNCAGGCTRVPVLDKAGLAGGWDFTLSFSPANQVQGPRPQPGGAPAGAASDPAGALSLPEAVRRQPGLKLKEEKRPLPVMVIDAILEKPSDD